MKKNKIIYLLLLVLVTGTMSSCKKYFLDKNGKDINIDPNNPSDVTPGVLLASAQGHLAYAQGGDISRYTSIFTQQVAGVSRQAAVYNGYTVTEQDVSNVWTLNLYGGPMEDLKILIDKSVEKKYRRYEGIGKVMMAYSLGLTTDLWGDVPYTEAFLGNDNLNPKYDTQASIYTNLQKMLDEAIVALNDPNPGAVTPNGTTDLMFGGSATSWIHFANALKARYYLHLSKVDPANYTNIINLLTAQAGNMMQDNSDDAGFAFAGGATSANPWFQFYDQRGDIIVAGVMADYMTSHDDSTVRWPFYTDQNDGYMGTYGQATSTVPFMTYEEQKFIEAEAKFKTGDLAGAATAYNDAVGANVAKVTGAAAPAAMVSDSATSISMDKIMMQKYIALFTNPEAWTDIRRTGIPAIAPPAGAVLTAMPRSFLYPESEQLYNTSAPKNTTMLRKVWWDK